MYTLFHDLIYGSYHNLQSLNLLEIRDRIHHMHAKKFGTLVARYLCEWMVKFHRRVLRARLRARGCVRVDLLYPVCYDLERYIPRTRHKSRSVCFAIAYNDDRTERRLKIEGIERAHLWAITELFHATLGRSPFLV